MVRTETGKSAQGGDAKSPEPFGGAGRATEPTRSIMQALRPDRRVSVKTKPNAPGSAKPALALVGAGLVLLTGFVLFRRRRVSGAAKSGQTALGAESRPVGAVLDLRPTVLICDDEPDIRLLCRQVMEASEAIVVEAASGEECLAIAEELRPGLVLLDLGLGGKSGLEVLAELRERYPLTAVVVMSGALSGAARTRAQELGAAESIDKVALVARIPGLVQRYGHTPLA